MEIKLNSKGQAVAPETRPMSRAAFEKQDGTSVYWLGSAGILLNVRGTVLAVDPLLEGFDMPLLVEPPIAPADIPHLDALLVTHIDNDHFSRDTCRDVAAVCRSYHAPHYVAQQMKAECGIDGIGHDIGTCFTVGDVKITPTPVLHTWQNDFPEFAYRQWKPEEYCGYRFDTPDGTIWLPGDSRLMEEHLAMDEPDVILFDFSDDSWHIGFENAVKLANTYPNSKLVCIHWGCVDAPDMAPFNPDPRKLFGKVTDPERICIPAPGEEFTL